MSGTDGSAAEPLRRGVAAGKKDQDTRTVMRLRLGVGVIGVLLPRRCRPATGSRRGSTAGPGRTPGPVR